MGKTTVAEHLGSKLFKYWMTIVGAHYADGAEVTGMYVIDNGQLTLMPTAMKNIAKWMDDNPDELALVILDEVLNAPPSTQAGLLRFLSEKEIAQKRYPNVRVIAFSNPDSMAPDNHIESFAGANRKGHYITNISPFSVAEGFENGWGEPVIPDELPRDLSQYLPKYRAAMGKHIRAQPDSLVCTEAQAEEMLSSDPDSLRYAVATPRTAEYLCRVMAACEALDINSSLSFELAVGLVGESFAADYIDGLDDVGYEPETMLKDPNNCPLPEESSRKVRVLDGVISSVKASRSGTRWNSCCVIASRMGREIVMSRHDKIADLRPASASFPPDYAEIYREMQRS